jgi:starvation-inducible DNA-binding protein
MASSTTPRYSIPGLTPEQGEEVGAILQGRLNALNDLALTLKHVHWNVVGRNFIAVHEMLDPQIDAVRTMVDDVAERMATMGVPPLGTPGVIVAQRTWDDYSIARATTQEHLGALDIVYAGVISDHRKAQERTADIDPVTEDLLIGQLAGLEKFHWFLRAHLEDASGDLSTAGATGERDAADQAGAANDLNA